MATETQTKSEVQPVMYCGNVWFIYTLGSTGSINIMCIISTNSVESYAAPVKLAGNTNVEEYSIEPRQ